MYGWWHWTFAHYYQILHTKWDLARPVLFVIALFLLFFLWHIFCGRCMLPGWFGGGEKPREVFGYTKSVWVNGWSRTRGSANNGDGYAPSMEIFWRWLGSFKNQGIPESTRMSRSQSIVWYLWDHIGGATEPGMICIFLLNEELKNPRILKITG